MPYTATVTQNDVILPDGHLYQSGDPVLLSDADYVAMGPVARAAVLTNLRAVAPGVTDGNTVLSKTSNPLAGDGVDGDYCINYATHTIFGPKASGTWPSGTALIGPGVPTGGASGTFLKKSSGADYATTFGAIAESDVTGLTSNLAGKVDASAVGAALGVASLDSSSLVEQAGSSGAWTANGVSTGTALAASGLTGAANTARLVGGGTAGAPVAGTFSTRDVIVNADGSIYVCTADGTPGTWVQVGTGP